MPFKWEKVHWIQGTSMEWVETSVSLQGFIRFVLEEYKKRSWERPGGNKKKNMKRFSVNLCGFRWSENCWVWWNFRVYRHTHTAWVSIFKNLYAQNFHSFATLHLSTVAHSSAENQPTEQSFLPGSHLVRNELTTNTMWMCVCFMVERNIFRKLTLFYDN